MAWANGTLYAQIALLPFGGMSSWQGIYTVDLNTLLMTQVMTYSGFSMAGLAFNPADGLLYAPDDISAQIMVIDLVAQTVTPVPGSAYPAGISAADLDGCTIGGGRVYLADDAGGFPVQVFNLGTGLWESPATTMTTFNASVAGAAWAPGLIGGPIGTNYCMAANNSAGGAGAMSANGSAYVVRSSVTLSASNLPVNQFGIFVASMTQDFIVGAGGTSNGNLCLGGVIGRINTVLGSGADGEYSLELNLNAVPQGMGTVAVMGGQTWSFQSWFRDQVGLGSNFTDGITIQFQ